MGSSSNHMQWADDETAYLATLQLVSHHGVAMAVKAAVELDVFNILARAGPGAQLSAWEITAKIPNCVDPTGAAARLDRVLRFLASHAILRCSFSPVSAASEAAERRYGLEPIYRLLQENHDGGSLAPAFLVTRDRASLGSCSALFPLRGFALNPAFSPCRKTAQVDDERGDHRTAGWDDIVKHSFALLQFCCSQEFFYSSAADSGGPRSPFHRSSSSLRSSSSRSPFQGSSRWQQGGGGPAGGGYNLCFIFRQYLKDAVLEDIDPFVKANGSKPFEYMANNARFAEIFNQYMAGVTKLTSEKIVDAYKGFDSITTLVDVGGGVGAMLGMIISKHPHVKGINFDLPHVISSAPIISGVEHVAGDIFVSIPTGDAIFLKWILHDWSDEECTQILKNCYRALPISGKAIVVEQILPENPERNDAVRDVYFMDLCMMVSFQRARERSEKEFRALASEAGFSGFKIAAYTMNYHVMEFIK